MNILSCPIESVSPERWDRDASLPAGILMERCSSWPTLGALPIWLMSPESAPCWPGVYKSTTCILNETFMTVKLQLLWLVSYFTIITENGTCFNTACTMYFKIHLQNFNYNYYWKCIKWWIFQWQNVCYCSRRSWFKSQPTMQKVQSTATITMEKEMLCYDKAFFQWLTGQRQDYLCFRSLLQRCGTFWSRGRWWGHGTATGTPTGVLVAASFLYVLSQLISWLFKILTIYSTSGTLPYYFKFVDVSKVYCLQ